MPKTLNDYTTMSYRMDIVENKDEGAAVASSPNLPGCITCGEAVERVVTNAPYAEKHGLNPLVLQSPQCYT